MRITFLGTSAGTPTRQRNVTAQVLRFDDGRTWLLDCGEGTQHQLMRAGVRGSRVERVLVTHLHGDHCYGLPGLLSYLGINGREDPVELVGPEGLRELVEVTLRLSAATLPFDLEIVELRGDGAALGARDGWTIDARPLVHRVPCFGYVLREHDRPGRFHPDRAQALGVPPGPLWKRLQSGQAAVLPDGRAVPPEAVVDPARRGRRLVLLGDTSGSDALAELGQGCDLLVHEATYDAARVEKALQWGHSTSAMAGAFARRLAARTLILTHFSSRFQEGHDDRTIDDLIAEAQDECPDTRVLAARDLWSFEIPG